MVRLFVLLFIHSLPFVSNCGLRSGPLSRGHFVQTSPQNTETDRARQNQMDQNFCDVLSIQFVRVCVYVCVCVCVCVCFAFFRDSPRHESIVLSPLATPDCRPGTGGGKQNTNIQTRFQPSFPEMEHKVNRSDKHDRTD